MSPRETRVVAAAGAVCILLAFPGLSPAASADNNTYQTFSGGSHNLGRSAYVGHEGAGNTLEINMGAEVTDGEACVGHAAPADHNSALVLGANSIWEHEGPLCVGKNGSDNRLIVAGGARVICGAGDLGENPGGDRNEARVVGDGSEWVVDGELTVGGKGASNKLFIDDGGLVVASAMGVGLGTKAEQNLVEVVDGAALEVMNDAGNAPCLVNGGTLSLLGGTVNANLVTVTALGTLRGAGTIIGSTFCSGSFQPGAPIGTLVSDGPVTLMDACRSEFDIGGYLAGDGFDRVNVGGSCRLGGSLLVTLQNGFVPQSGDQFEIIRASSVSGDFGSVEVIPNPGLDARVVRTATSVFVEFGPVQVQREQDRVEDSTRYANPNSAEGAADDDGDGQNNYQEYVAGTDVHNADSKFRIEVEPEETETAVKFMSRSDRTYTLEYTQDISKAGGPVWTKVASNVKGLGGLMELIHANPDERGYYRVAVRVP